MPVYIEKSGDLVGCHHSRTDDRTRKDRASQPMDHELLRGEITKSSVLKSFVADHLLL